jgi:hypothetical protein
VLRVAADPPYLLHLEFVAGHDTAELPRKLLVRNSLLCWRTGMKSACAAAWCCCTRSPIRRS